MIKFTKPTCPKCNEPASSILARLFGDARLRRNEDGTYAYTGQTDVDWDSREPHTNEQDNVFLTCAKHHEWKAEIASGA